MYVRISGGQTIKVIIDIHHMYIDLFILLRTM